MLSPEDRRTLLEDWSGPPFDPTLFRDELLHEIFEHTAAQFPTNLALDCAGETLTYAALNNKANQLAAHLRSQNISPLDHIAIFLPRGNSNYLAMLAILKAGAAYVPLDPDYPTDRIAHILADANCKAILTAAPLAQKIPTGPWQQIQLDQLHLSTHSTQNLSLPTRNPTDTAYIIYTSGSTGQPKGVPIPHRSICNLIRAEQKLFAPLPTDRVFQGFSIAFDASLEEIWLAFASGATLLPATSDMLRSGPALATTLANLHATILSTVPTLLSMFHEDIPSLRLLILGGEVCPQDLIQKHHRPSLRIVNTYGPTEATVIASYADCLPNKPVTIGKPVPNYKLYILDDAGQLIPPGTPGELCISGPGLSPGYLHRPDLTKEKFKPNPFSPTAPYDRIYRTGDLVRHVINPTAATHGEIEFLGRIDSQIKLRGFRIELAEIESAIRQSVPQNSLRNVAVTLREDTPGLQQLIAYLVPTSAVSVDIDTLHAALRLRLPSYMLPSGFELLEQLPTLPSGKTDRKSLPAPQNLRATTHTTHDVPQTPREIAIAAAWQKFLPASPLSRTDHFFLDLGAHSLMAARVVSDLRSNPDFTSLSVLDLYNFPTTEKLAAELDTRTTPQQTPAPSAPAKPSPKNHALFSLAQFFSLYFVIAFYSLQWLTPYLTYVWCIEHEQSRTASIAYALGMLLALYPVMLLATIAAKWLFLGKLKPGRYPLYSFFHLRWWLVQRITDAVAVEYLEGTILLNLYYKLMGAKIGKRVHFGSYNIGAFDLVSVGDHSSLDDSTALMANTIEDGHLILGPITIGKNCYIAPSAVLRPNTEMADNSRLLHMSMLPSGTKIPANETWFGSPARPLENAPPPPPNPKPAGTLKRLNMHAWHTLGVFLLPLVYLIALFPGLILLNAIAIEYGEYWSLLAAPAVAFMFIILLCFEIIIVKWLLLGRVKPGDYCLFSPFSFRKWFVDQLMGLSLDVMGQLYATLYLNPWYRMLGAKMGRRAEISTACAASPDLLDIGEESFIADAVLLGVPKVENEILSLRTTTIGRRAFVGNSAVLPAGAKIADESLIGVLSIPPLTPLSTQPHSTWLGSPPIFLPQRQASATFSEETTFRPTRKLIAQRLFIEFIRIMLPITMFVVFTSLLITTVVEVAPYFLPIGQLLIFPLLYFAAGLCACLFVILAKWLLIGRYKPCEKPLWSTFVWRSELLNALHEKLAGAYLTDMLLGTPLLNLFFRALGMHIGKRVYLDSAEFTEFDLVRLDDDCVLNIESTIQTHLFEDRVMKMSTISIGKNASVGACSVVLYDSHLADGSILEDLSLVMKGESLSPNTRYRGSPSRPVPPN